MATEPDDAAPLVDVIKRRVAAVGDKGEPHRSLARAWDDWERLRPGRASVLLDEVGKHAAAGCDLCHFSLVLHPENPLDVPATARLALFEVDELLAEKRAGILAWNVIDIATRRPPPASDYDHLGIVNLRASEHVRWAVFFTRDDADEAAIAAEAARLIAASKRAPRALRPPRARELLAAASPLSTPGIVLVDGSALWLIELAPAQAGIVADPATRLAAAAQSSFAGDFSSATVSTVEETLGVSITRVR